MPNFRQRKWLFIAIAISIVMVLTLVGAPNSGGRINNSGSTYGRGADGYGAWYEYMSTKQTAIKRWKKPFSQFVQSETQGVTYIKIRSKADYLVSTPNLSQAESKWVRQGNTLVVLGVMQSASAAPFKSLITHRPQPLSSSQIEIETTRRRRSRNQDKSLLSDRYGAVVWSESVGRGKVIYSTTPFLAANAYQDSPDNFKFLAELVSDNQTIWIDEYIHGYKDKETIVQEKKNNVINYLAQTPLYLLFIQIIIMGCVAAVTAFRRFGKPIMLKTAIADNSTAYIDALAGVLEKANSTDFVMDTVGKDEQRKLQLNLGLGKSLVDDDELLTACQQQQSESLPELKQLLKMNQTKSKISSSQLAAWVEKWQQINQINKSN